MKLFILTFLMITPALSAEFTECRNAAEAKLRMMPGTIPAGALAVDFHGNRIGLKEVLADEMVRFQTADGKITDTYQWMYNQIFKVENRDDKYLSSSYGEDVIITVTRKDRFEPQNKIEYVGTESGKYLTLLCN